MTSTVATAAFAEVVNCSSRETCFHYLYWLHSTAAYTLRKAKSRFSVTQLSALSLF